MIRRGTPLSRLLAGIVAAIPILAAIALVFLGALYIWRGQSERYAEEQYLLRRAMAESEQARLYDPLREAWRDYARTDLSGLSQAADAQTAETDMRRRLAEIFARFDGRWISSETLAAQAEPGIERLRVEARGELPEAQLFAFLEALETDTPFMFLDLFDARMKASGSAGSQTLALRLQVSTYRLSEPES